LKKKKKASRKKEAAQVKLDLGCGMFPRPGFDGVDFEKGSNAKYHLDLRDPWPWKDDSVDEVYSQQFVEHLEPYDRIHFFNELWRVLKVGAKATLVTPYWSSMRATQDMTHKWPPLSEASYAYYDESWRCLNGLSHERVYPSCRCDKRGPRSYECNFSFMGGHGFAPDIAIKSEEARAMHSRHYNNSVNDLWCTVTKVARLDAKTAKELTEKQAAEVRRQYEAAKSQLVGSAA
jgi:hypothetical protein